MLFYNLTYVKGNYLPNANQENMKVLKIIYYNYNSLTNFQSMS